VLDAIIKGLRNHSTKLWLTLTAGILLIVYKYLPLSFVPSILPSIKLDRWAQLSVLLLILVTALSILLRIRHHEIKRILDTKLTAKFGILWDRNKQPHCKKCQVLLAQLKDHQFLESDLIDSLNRGINPNTVTIKNCRYFCKACNTENMIVNDGKITPYTDIKDSI